jgi:hypothetical protein
LIYKLRNETYDDDELEAMSDADLDLLRADCKAEKAHVEADIKRAQFEYKNRLGPGLSATEHARKDLEVAEIKELEYQIEYLQLDRVHSD